MFFFKWNCVLLLELQWNVYSSAHFRLYACSHTHTCIFKYLLMYIHMSGVVEEGRVVAQ